MLLKMGEYLQTHRAEFLLQVWDHLRISLYALLAASVIGIICGYFGSRSKKSERIVSLPFEVLRVVPSLAILVLLIPIMGTGVKSAVVALTILAVPPILLNTIVGFREVPDFVLESARGIGMNVIAYDVYKNPSLDFVKYVPLDELLSQSDLISLHCPLTDQTYHMIDFEAIEKMKQNVILINTSRGALIDTNDLIKGIRAYKFAGVGLDVYEEEDAFVFENLEDDILLSSVPARLLSFPNVVITSHQGFLTKEALDAISRATLENAKSFERGSPIPQNVVK